MDFVVDFINNNISLAPFFIVFILTINSVGLPISEDVIVTTAALLSVKFPNMVIPLYLGCFIGAYSGDMFSYWVWRLIGGKLLERPFWKKRFKPEDIERFNHNFRNKGAIIFIVGRFIPFGVRILICMAAGISKYDFPRFAIFDLIAAFVSVGTVFFLFYRFGKSIQNDLGQLKFIIFIAVVIFAIIFFLYKKVIAKKVNNKEQ